MHTACELDVYVLTHAYAHTHAHAHAHAHTHTHTHAHCPPFLHIQVYRLPVEECSNFTDCSSCTTRGDRLCGWCSVENKCSRSIQCANSSRSLRWIQDGGRCLTVEISSAESISGDFKSYPREQQAIVSLYINTSHVMINMLKEH